jgi:hypothetical protein
MFMKHHKNVCNQSSEIGTIYPVESIKYIKYKITSNMHIKNTTKHKLHFVFFY